MTDASFLSSPTFSLFVLPVLIFLGRICDVSIGTIRIIFVSRGYRHLAPVLGFFEVTIWLVAIGQVMSHLTSVQHYIAYGLGFATGNYVGMYLEQRLAIGTQVIRVITRQSSEGVLKALRGAGHFVTTVDAEGEHGPVDLIFLTAARKDIAGIITVVKHHTPDAVYTVEDVRMVSQGMLAAKRRAPLRRLPLSIDK